MQVFQYFIYKSAQVWFRHIKNIFFFLNYIGPSSLHVGDLQSISYMFFNSIEKKLIVGRIQFFFDLKKKCLKKVKTNHTKIDPTNINKNKHMYGVNERKYKRNQQKCELSYMCMCITHIVYMYTMCVCETRC